MCGVGRPAHNQDTRATRGGIAHVDELQNGASDYTLVMFYAFVDHEGFGHADDYGIGVDLL